MVETIGIEQVRRQESALRDLVAEFDSDSVPLPEVAELWCGFTRLARLASAAGTLLARRMEDSPAWQEAGCRSAPEFMARRSGGSVRACRDQVRASRRLAELPEVAAALRRGELSMLQVELVAGAASANPAKQEHLVGLAQRVSLVELGQECLRIKAAADPDPDATHRRIHRDRFLRQRADAEGAWCLSGRGTPETGALLQHALAPIVDQIYDQARHNGDRDHRDAYMLDAFVELLNRYLDPHEQDPDATVRESDAQTSGRAAANDETGLVAEGAARSAGHETDDSAVGAPGGGAPSSSGAHANTEGAAPEGRSPHRRPPAKGRLNPRHLALLRIDVEALRRGHVEGDELVEIAGVGPVPVARARELLGDAIVKLVITKGVAVANVTHLGRAPTVAQHVALLWQTPSCSNEACAHTYVENDHREPWAKTRHTRVDETDPLCGHDHRLKHHAGWSLVEGIGKRAFVPPTAPRHPDNTRARAPTAGADADPHQRRVA